MAGRPRTEACPQPLQRLLYGHWLVQALHKCLRLKPPLWLGTLIVTSIGGFTYVPLIMSQTCQRMVPADIFRIPRRPLLRGGAAYSQLVEFVIWDQKLFRVTKQRENHIHVHVFPRQQMKRSS